jgi:formylglycine-generating enzyme required for sulfatase activity
MNAPQTIQFDTRLPPLFPPPWAIAWGDDRFGLWAELEVGQGDTAVVQRMRWIAPGQFVMGSPEAETAMLDRPERWEYERPQHPVTISQGFWLADTACTQAFWQAVMGDNPSHFNANKGGGSQHPVECVSWNMIQPFLQKLQITCQGDHASLPTEAEWEYACRAGSATPFHFGANITPRQANYDGNYPYADGEKGEYRKRTVPVKDLPANRWGLYQMHGNVWEWCADGFRTYTAAPIRDPGLAEVWQPALEQEAVRALRGGSWLGSALYVSSTYRNHNRPGGQGRGTGFRLALRSSGLASRF